MTDQPNMVAAHDELVTKVQALLNEQAPRMSPRTLEVFGLAPSVHLAADKLTGDDDSTKIARVKKLIFLLKLANLVAGNHPVVRAIKQHVDEVLRRHSVTT